VSVSWTDARRRARAAARPLPVTSVELPAAVGSVLAEPLVAQTDLPPFDSSAMDGWAVGGPGPWTIVGEVFAGDEPGRLADGTGVRVTTGAALPIGADGVIRREDGVIRLDKLHYGDADTGRLREEPGLIPDGLDVRPRGQEARRGDTLLVAGGVVTPVVAGLAAAAGYDELKVVRPPTVAVIVVGDELLVRGPARDHRIRDSLGPMVPGWLASFGAQAFPPIHVPDDITALRDAIDDANADLIVTTGSTARGKADHLHQVLEQLSATLVIDGVDVRPGHPMALATLPDGRIVVGLPGNPLAAVSALVTLAAPVIAAMRGEAGADVADEVATLTATLRSHPTDSRLVPVRRKVSAGLVTATPLTYAGPSMLRGLAVAEALAVVPPGAGEVGSSVVLLPLP